MSGISLIPCVISGTMIGMGVGAAGGSAALGIGAIPGALCCGLLGAVSGFAIWLTLLGSALLFKALLQKASSDRIQQFRKKLSCIFKVAINKAYEETHQNEYITDTNLNEQYQTKCNQYTDEIIDTITRNCPDNERADFTAYIFNIRNKALLSKHVHQLDTPRSIESATTSAYQKSKLSELIHHYEHCNRRFLLNTAIDHFYQLVTSIKNQISDSLTGIKDYFSIWASLPTEKIKEKYLAPRRQP